MWVEVWWVEVWWVEVRVAMASAVLHLWQAEQNFGAIGSNVAQVREVFKILEAGCKYEGAGSASILGLGEKGRGKREVRPALKIGNTSRSGWFLIRSGYSFSTRYVDFLPPGFSR